MADVVHTISRARAALILSVHIATVDRLIRAGVLTPGRRFATAQLSLDQVEQLALATRPVRRLVAGDDSYWVTRAGAARIRLHDLRHTHATLALRAAVHPRVVQERLGHANVGITLDTYSHVDLDMQAAAAARVAALVNGGGQ